MEPQDLYHAVKAGRDAKSFLLEWHQQRSAERETTALLPTICLPKLPRKGGDALFIDEQGRLCLKIADVEMPTLALADEAVERFRAETDNYPSEIVICPSRYSLATASSNNYYGRYGNVCIPYAQEFGSVIDYDVICRG